MEHTRVEVFALCLAICISSGYARVPTKIIGGRIATIRDFPYQVSLQQSGQPICGGSIVDATHILTAAHCVIEKDTFKVKNEIEVVTGTNDKFRRTADNVFPVSKVLYHQAYTLRPLIKNDIAVLKLTKPIAFNAHQSPIKLPTTDIPDSVEVVASGWGIIKYNENDILSAQYLQKLVMKVVNTEDCAKSDILMKYKIDDRQICVIGKKNSGVCLGDSGGPLTYNDEVVGVVSFVIPCAYGVPDIFTRVYPYLQWIRWAMSN